MSSLRLRTLFVVLFCVAFVGSSASQRRKQPRKHGGKHERGTSASIHTERSAKEDELGRLKREIADYERQLRDHEAKANRSKQNLSAFNRRTAELESAISRLEARVSQLEEKKEVVEDSIQTTSKTLDRLKSAYASGARFLYMSGSLEAKPADELLLGSGAMDDHLRQQHYAMLVARAHTMNRERLDSAKHALGVTEQGINSAITHESNSIDARAAEAERVAAQTQQETKRLAAIEQDRGKLQKILKQKQESARRLERMIADLIFREEKAAKARKDAEAKRAAAAKSTGHREKASRPKDDVIASGPAYGPHSLQWPTASHQIRQAYGEHRNAELNTVTMNLGIDIGAEHGSAVHAVADGVVSLVSSLPSYGTIVVLQHSGGLHTVYADLSGVAVSVGASVRAGQAIARTGSNEELGNVLHFEVWKGKSRQNPMGWLR